MKRLEDAFTISWMFLIFTLGLIVITYKITERVIIIKHGVILLIVLFIIFFVIGAILNYNKYALSNKQNG